MTMYNEVISKNLKFSKIEEKKEVGKYFYNYDVLFFQNDFFTYDFLVYISHRAKVKKITFFDKNQYKDTKPIEEIEKSITNFKNYCKDNKLDVSFLYTLGNGCFSITKFHSHNIIAIVTNDDETKVENLTSIIEILKNDYIVYTESEFLYGYFSNDYSLTNLIGAYDLLSKMLKTNDDNQFNSFYEKNIKWLKEHFSVIKNDRIFWKDILADIENKINETKY